MAYILTFSLGVPDSVRETVRDELGAATRLLRDDFDADPVEAVHEARKSLKKTRALLRLVRPGLGRQVYRRENAALRDAARLVSGARDADVVVETVEALAKRYAGRIPAADFDGLRDHLRAEAFDSRVGATGGASRADAVAMLDAVAGRIDDWPLERCDWGTVVAGMDRAYRAGREAFARVIDPAGHGDPSVELLHDWRKRVKDIWYHQRLICPAWPDVLGAQAEEAHRLSEILGDDHDLAVLAERLRGADGPPPPVPLDPNPLLALVAARRAELLAEARHLGSLVYAEKPSAFVRRIGRYLDAAQTVIGEADDGPRL